MISLRRKRAQVKVTVRLSFAENSAKPLAALPLCCNIMVERSVLYATTFGTASGGIQPRDSSASIALSREGCRMRELLWFAITLAIPIIVGAAEEWQPISPQDLSMTSEPKAPGAAAVTL